MQGEDSLQTTLDDFSEEQSSCPLRFLARFISFRTLAGVCLIAVAVCELGLKPTVLLNIGFYLLSTQNDSS